MVAFIICFSSYAGSPSFFALPPKPSLWVQSKSSYAGSPSFFALPPKEPFPVPFLPYLLFALQALRAAEQGGASCSLRCCYEVSSSYAARRGPINIFIYCLQIVISSDSLPKEGRFVLFKSQYKWKDIYDSLWIPLQKVLRELFNFN